MGGYCGIREDPLVLLPGGLASAPFAATAFGSVFLSEHFLLFGLNICINLSSSAGLVAVHLSWQCGVLLGCSRLLVTFA